MLGCISGQLLLGLGGDPILTTTIDVSSDGTWDACTNSLEHLFWHKQLTILGPKIKRLPDDHPSKLNCLFKLSQLFGLVRNHREHR